MPNRTYSLSSGSKYRFGFNGMEKDDEPYGIGNLYTSHYRGYDSRIGRWLSTDPEEEEFPGETPYNNNQNNPIVNTDPNGNCPWCIVIGLVMIADVLNAPTGNAENDKKATDEAKKNRDISLATSFVPIPAPMKTSGSLMVKETAKQVVTKSTIKQVSKTIAKKVVNETVVKQANENIKKNIEKTSRATRRESMRKSNIPTSQQPKSQSKNESGREYTYEVDGKIKSVQQQTKDRNHPEEHWEAGDVKVRDGQIQYNNYERPKLENTKSKVEVK